MNKYFNFMKIPGLMVKVMTAFPVTVKLVLFSLLFSLLIGFVFACMALAKSKLLNAMAKVISLL